MERINVFFIKRNIPEMLSGAMTGFTLEFWPLWVTSSSGRITEVIIHFDNETKYRITKNTKSFFPKNKQTKKSIIFAPSKFCFHA